MGACLSASRGCTLAILRATIARRLRDVPSCRLAAHAAFSRAALSHRARPCVGFRGASLGSKPYRSEARRCITGRLPCRVPQAFHHHLHPDLRAVTRSFTRHSDMLVTPRRGRSGPAHSDRSRKPSAAGSPPRDVSRGFQDVNGGTSSPEWRSDRSRHGVSGSEVTRQALAPPRGASRLCSRLGYDCPRRR